MPKTYTQAKPTKHLSRTQRKATVGAERTRRNQKRWLAKRVQELVAYASS